MLTRGVSQKLTIADKLGLKPYADHCWQGGLGVRKFVNKRCTKNVDRETETHRSDPRNTWDWYKICLIKWMDGVESGWKFLWCYMHLWCSFLRKKQDTFCSLYFICLFFHKFAFCITLCDCENFCIYMVSQIQFCNAGIFCSLWLLLLLTLSGFLSWD